MALFRGLKALLSINAILLNRADRLLNRAQSAPQQREAPQHLTNMKEKTALSAIIREGRCRTTGSMMALVARLAVPSVMAQLAMIVMEYIDAAMVGSLGAVSAASIGLIATSTWLFNGVCGASATGFYVQVAHYLGAGRPADARSVARQAFTAVLLFCVAVGLTGVLIAPHLPHWLGAPPEIQAGASAYFMIFSAALPVMGINFLATGLLRCAGNVTVPGLLGVGMCVLDVVFNYFLIFPTRQVNLLGSTVTMPGAGLGVEGAAIGTASAALVTTVIVVAYLWWGRSELRMSGERGSFRPVKKILMRAVRVASPIGAERFITNMAQVVLTIIVAPLGAAAIAANSFAVTVEGFCYMPGYGIGDAATTLTGQCLGAGNKPMARRFANLTVLMGMVTMGLMGVLMYLTAPAVIGLMTPDAQIVDLGVMALRIEAWAEPLFAASIVCYGVFVGAGDTLIPCGMNLGSMWVVRITLAALLAPVMGLKGVWIAMCVELCFRGIIFLIRLRSGAWLTKTLIK